MRILLLPVLLAAFAGLSACGSVAPAPPATVEAAKGEIVRAIIPSPSLDGDLAGDETPSEALIFLPPGYAQDAARRYPMVVLLHGYWSAPGQWEDDYISITNLYAAATVAGTAKDLIIVMPSGDNRLGGGFYVNGAASGNWEDYIAEDVVAYMDANYRTLANRESRGIAGHSMGGYGAFSVAASRPDVFSAMYAMSPCCGALVEDFGPDSPGWAAADALESQASFEASEDFLARVLSALGAAWAPDPAAPLMSRRPYSAAGVDESVRATWQAKTLGARLETDADNLRQLTAIALDVGDKEDFPHILQSVPDLAARMQAAGLPVEYEMYPGDHVSGVGKQLEEEVLPFFSQHLAGD